MIIVPGQPGKDLCDPHLGIDPPRPAARRRLGPARPDPRLAAPAARPRRPPPTPPASRAAPGWGKAKSVILVYLQGGPSHLDLWDPKDNVPDNVRSVFKPIATKLPGVQFTEILPKLAQVNDKITLIRSMSYTPNGLFNHTAAIYQMMTGYTTDKVSPSGQLEPPNPKDFPNFGSNIVRLKPPTVPMLPFVMLPRPLQESNVIGKGGTAGFLGKALRPVHALSRTATTWTWPRWTAIKVDDLQAPARGLRRPPRAPRQAPRRDQRRHARDRQGRRASTTSTRTTTRRSSLVLSGRAREAFDLDAGDGRDSATATAGTRSARACLLARRLVEAGTRVVEVDLAEGRQLATTTRGTTTSA